MHPRFLTFLPHDFPKIEFDILNSEISPDTLARRFIVISVFRCFFRIYFKLSFVLNGMLDVSQAQLNITENLLHFHNVASSDHDKNAVRVDYEAFR